MGYLQVADAYTFVLGSPASVETTFIIEGAMDKLLEAALPRYRQILATLDAIECQMVGDLENMAVESLGGIKINAREQKQLVSSYDYWVAALSNMLGCPRNPFDKRLQATSGVNVRVAG
jgi:hypothetical protein